MGFFKSKKGSIISDYFMLLEDIGGGYTAKNMYDVALYDDHLEISSPLAKNKINLEYSKIKDVVYSAEVEEISKSKSSIGRAVAGGVLFGGVGAVVGAISGTGTKTKKERHFYFIIAYTSAQGEEKFLQFEDTRLYKGTKIAKKLKELCRLDDNNNTDDINL
ncbi:MAG: hypothetical protein IKJ41_10980 [Clostridia bacterium]|nr:hypothetical protein [Clostridia bacterium]